MPDYFFNYLRRAFRKQKHANKTRQESLVETCYLSRLGQELAHRPESRIPGLSPNSSLHLFFMLLPFWKAHTFLFFFLVLATQSLKIEVFKKTTRQARNNHWFNDPLSKYGQSDRDIINVVFCFMLFLFSRKLSPKDGVEVHLRKENDFRDEGKDKGAC